MKTAQSQNTLTLDLRDRQTAIKVAELSCAKLEILRLRPEQEEQGSLLKYLNNKDCTAWFSRKGFTFHVSRHGYRLIGDAYVSRCGRIIESVDDLVNRINKPPYETPYLKEWGQTIYEALEARYIKPMVGYNPVGKHLAKELMPRHLDEIISSLVKRKILTF